MKFATYPRRYIVAEYAGVMTGSGSAPRQRRINAEANSVVVLRGNSCSEYHVPHLDAAVLQQLVADASDHVITFGPLGPESSCPSPLAHSLRRWWHFIAAVLRPLGACASSRTMLGAPGKQTVIDGFCSVAIARQGYDREIVRNDSTKSDAPRTPPPRPVDPTQILVRIRYCLYPLSLTDEKPRR